MKHVPVTVLDPERMMALTTKQYMAFRDRMVTEFTREWAEATLREFLRCGLVETLKVIEDADQGDDIAHRALVCVFAEMQTPPTQLRAYVERAALRGPITRKPGQYGPHDHLLRNLGIAVLVYSVHINFGLGFTRNRESRRARQDSACSVVSTVLRRDGVDISESRVQNIWSGLAGAVITFAAARRMFPSIIPN